MYTCIQEVTVVKLFCFRACTVVHAHCECPSLRKTKVYFAKLSINTGRKAKVLINRRLKKTGGERVEDVTVQGAPSLLPVHHRVTIQLVERTNPSAYLLTPVSPCSNPCPPHLLSLTIHACPREMTFSTFYGFDQFMVTLKASVTLMTQFIIQHKMMLIKL